MTQPPEEKTFLTTKNTHTEPMNTTSLRKSQLIGFWTAPSRSLAEHNPDAYNAALANAPKIAGLGNCSHCGRAITENVIVLGEDGVVRPVGTSCAEWVGVSDEEVAEAREAARQAAEAARWKAAQARIEPSVFHGGKYVGRLISEVLAEDLQYCEFIEGRYTGQRSHYGVSAAEITRLLKPSRDAAEAAAKSRAATHAELIAELRGLQVWVTQQKSPYGYGYIPLENPYLRSSAGAAHLADCIEQGKTPHDWAYRAAADDAAKAAGHHRRGKKAQSAHDAFTGAFLGRIEAALA